MPATTRERRLRAGQKAAERVDQNNPTRATRPAARKRSRQATLALDAYGDLRRFFTHDVDLAQALGWDEATAAQWRDRRLDRRAPAHGDRREAAVLDS